MKRLPRGLIAALGASIVAHAALVASGLPETAAGAAVAASPAMTARIVPEPRAADAAAATSTAPAAVEAEAPTVDPTSQQAPNTPQAAVLPIAAPASAASSIPLPVTVIAAAPGSAVPPTGTEPPTLAELPAAPASGAPGDHGPQPIDDVDADIVRGVGIRGGTVVLRLVISERGVVESAEVVRSTPPGLLDAATIAAIGKSRFAPAIRNGAAVRETVTFELTVAPAGRGAEASGRTY